MKRPPFSAKIIEKIANVEHISLLSIKEAVFLAEAVLGAFHFALDVVYCLCDTISKFLCAGVTLVKSVISLYSTLYIG